jgi:hypothetical protein
MPHLLVPDEHACLHYVSCEIKFARHDILECETLAKNGFCEAPRVFRESNWTVASRTKRLGSPQVQEVGIAAKNYTQLQSTQY